MTKDVDGAELVELIRQAFDGTDIPAKNIALRKAHTALTTASAHIRAEERRRIVTNIRATMCDCSGQFIASEIERGEHEPG